MNGLVYLRATSWAEASQELSKKNTLAKAGGTDLWDRLKEHLDAPERVVSLLSIPEASSIEIMKDGATRIGALVTIAEIAEHAGLRAHFPALTEAAGTLATPAVRNAATLGGNLVQRPRCHYFRSELFPCLRKGGASCFAMNGDNRAHAIFDNTPCVAVSAPSTASPLAALSAEAITLEHEQAGRRIKISELFVRASENAQKEVQLRPAELIVAVELPAVASGSRNAYGKVRARESLDWPLVEVAVALSMRGEQIQAASIYLGSVAMIPWHAAAAEQLLVGQKPAPALFKKAGQAAVSGATPLSMNGYKIPLLIAEVGRVLEKAARGSV